MVKCISGCKGEVTLSESWTAISLTLPLPAATLNRNAAGEKISETEQAGGQWAGGSCLYNCLYDCYCGLLPCLCQV